MNESIQSNAAPRGRRIDLRPYDVQVGERPAKMQAGGEIVYEPIFKPYSVCETAVNILLHPERRLNGTRVLKLHDLGRRILDAAKTEEPEILLTEQDWGELRDSIEQFGGFGRPDVEFVRRVLEAPTVEMTALLGG